MAGIDKTYINGKEYPIYRQWWIDNYDKMLKELGDYISMYPFIALYEIDVTPELLMTDDRDIHYAMSTDEIVLWNTSERVDKWLIKNCPIQSFRNRMIDVYSRKWSGFKGVDWLPKVEKKQKYVNKR